MTPRKIDKLERWGACAFALACACGGDDLSTHQRGAGERAVADASVASRGIDAGMDAELPDLPCDEPDAGLPDDVFCTGLYLHRDPTRYQASAAPYTPGVTLWSDGADKHRYLYLPPGSQIDTSNMDAWHFPVGTKVWKEFRVDGALIETRLLWKRADAHWDSGTYVWDKAGSNATLNTKSKGTVLDSGYEIPAPRDCDKCHHGGSDKLLGVEALALALPSAQGMTLAKLAAAGFLSDPPAPLTVELPEDATGKASAALGYVHANCGMPCHSTRGLGDETQLVLRLRADEFWPARVAVEQTDIYKATVGQRPTTASVAQAFPDAQRVTKGAHEQSLIWLLSHVRGKYQMPPLVSHRVDDVGTERLADWIDALRN